MAGLQRFDSSGSYQVVSREGLRRQQTRLIDRVADTNWFYIKKSWAVRTRDSHLVSDIEIEINVLLSTKQTVTELSQNL